MKKRLKWVLVMVLLAASAMSATAQEIVVLGSQEETMTLLNGDRWWKERKPGQRLEIPHVLVLAISERWKNHAPKMPVDVKKEIFFSSLLPMVLHANSMVLDRRDLIRQADAKLAGGGTLTEKEMSEVRRLSTLLRIAIPEKIDPKKDTGELRRILKESLYKLDVIPPGLVLGQAAYESGYATSRFAVQGNALFGQWTYGEGGMVPGQQRKKLGDHRIASYEWPFDSVRGYFLNLSSHPAYEDFRRIRSRLKTSGKALSSLALADGLKSYSERGQEYVDTLKGIIKANGLDIADGAAFRDEPLSFIWGAEDKAAASKLKKDIEDMRKSGEISTVIDRMRLE